MYIAYRAENDLPGIQEMEKAKKRLLIISAHILLWLAFLSIPAVFNPRREAGAWGYVSDLLEPPRSANALLLIIVFYFNYYIAIPQLYIRRRYLLLALSFICSFGIFFLLNYSMMPPEIKQAPTRGFNALGNSFNLFMFIIVCAFSFVFCLYGQWQRAKERMLNAEISFLKAQVNPHFLFNTLNSIYSLALTKSDSAPDAIIKLSGMMRYTVSEASQEVVSLSKEFNYISDYVALQKLRLHHNVKISYEISGRPDGNLIAPFILIPFVENAFRHGVNSEGDSDINIKIDISENVLALLVTNKKVFMRQDKETGIGLGINNTRTRLKLLYPGKHTLVIDDNMEQFSVSLKIELA